LLSEFTLCRPPRREMKWGSMKHWFGIGFFLLGTTLSASSQPAATPVKVWQGTLALPTYEEGLPDANPPFDVYATTRFNYPYTLRTNLTGVKSTHAWRAVFLENAYLKCTVLPDIGGHIYTCVDKISGKPMFYANPSIKKAQIGYRGAWAAFGVEFNFPVSHNWVSMSPVDFAFASHADGSGSVWVGNIDRVFGMQWQVELVLRPGSTVLEQHTTLYNRSDLRHRYYWWSNAGVQVGDDSRVEYPMRFVASHGFTDVYSWPVGPQGDRDLRVIKNQTLGPVSYFIHGSREPFMGIWHPQTQTGVAHFAEFSEVPGKKIWSWGVDPAGLEWRTALSDNRSAYVEVQAGLFRNQETYAFLDPGQVIHFTEYWMPVRGTGGMTRVNRAGVVHLDVQNHDASVALNVNERLPGAHIFVTQGESVLLSQVVDLGPEKTWSHSVALKNSAAKVTFELKDKAGHTLLKQTDGEYDWDPVEDIQTGPQARTHFPDPANRSADDWLQLGRNEELNGEAVVALATYRLGLEHDPASQSLAIACGRLAASLQQYDDAERLLKAAQKRDTSNSEIAYYLGIAAEGLGHTRAAETSYEIAYRQAALRGPAALRLGELRARQGDLQNADLFLRDAVAADPDTYRPREELEAVLRAQGEKKDADDLAKIALASEPESDFLKQDTGRPDRSHLAADPYRVLSVAAEYMRLGLYRNALAVLTNEYPAVAADQSEPGSVLPQKNPLTPYYAAFCNKHLATDDKHDLQAASKLSTSFIFPSSETDRMVLQSASSADAGDANAHFLLGTLLFSKGMTDAGMAQWTEAKRLAPRLPVIDADMGEALLELKHDPERALASFREGIQNDSENEALYVGLDEAMSLTGASAAVRADALSQYPTTDAPHSKMPENLVYQLALARAEANQFAPALSLFKDRFFASEEGGITSDQVQFEIESMQAKAWAEAGNCAAAQAFAESPQTATSLEEGSARDYVQLATIARACGHAEEASNFLRKAAASDGGTNLFWVVQAEEMLGAGVSGDARTRLTDALHAAEDSAETGASSGSWCYNTALLNIAVGEKARAKQLLLQTLLLPDSRMSHHLARLALASIAAGQ
jgi:Flp pilus assembly protein TadD